MPPKRKADAAFAKVDGESKEAEEGPERKKRAGICQHADCEKTASYGFVGGKRTHCGPHALPGMDNLKSKKCEAEDCEKQANYGFVGGRKTHCGPHALPGMDNLSGKKCEAEDCGKQAVYGLELGKPTHCKKHKSEVQFDVTNKKCAEPGCGKQPKFGWKGEDALFCKAHSKEGMIDVVHKKCLEPGCDSRPFMGLRSGKAQWCADHATDDMINLINKLCEEEGCFKRACFGFTKGQPTHCRDHGDLEMENVKDKSCQGPGCKKTHIPYGNHLTGRAFCATCRDPKQHWKLTTCTKDTCRKVATHSESGYLPFVFCEAHASCEFSSYLEARCKKCNLQYICNEEGFCDICTPTKKYEKVSENLMKAFFEKKGLTFEHNIQSAGSACSNNRPDFLFRTPFGLVAVENDEHQHSDRFCQCEQQRMVGLREAFGEAVHFIRFNPDVYKPTIGKKRSNRVHLDKRHEHLFGIVKSILNDPLHFFTRFSGLSVSYMYYDDCDTPTSWQPTAIVY
jgi:hypothetical protein